MTPELNVPAIEQAEPATAPHPAHVQAAFASTSFARLSYGIAPAAHSNAALSPAIFWRDAAYNYVKRFAVPALTAVSDSVAAASKVIIFLAALYAIYMLAAALSAVRPARPSSRLARLAARTRYALWQLEQQLPASDRAQTL